MQNILSNIIILNTKCKLKKRENGNNEYEKDQFSLVLLYLLIP
jgi:hypothetical protein